MSVFMPKKYIFIVIPLFLIFLLLPHYVNAGLLSFMGCSVATGGNLAACVISEVFYGIALVISTVISWFLALLGAMIDWVLAIPIDGNPVLQFGWTWSRNLVNIFLVLGMLIIGIATILRVEEYGVKKALVRLIIAALLINFSLMIAGVFIDFADVFTNFFLGKIKGDKGFSEVLMGASGFDQFYSKLGDFKNPPSFLETWATAGKAVIGAFIGLLFTIAMGVLLLIAFAAVFVLFLFRYMALIILLIVAPFAWFFWVFPGLSAAVGQSIWSKWWSTFFKWVLFAPIMLFFIYIAVGASGKIWDFNYGTSAGQNLSSSVVNDFSVNSSLLVVGVNMCIILALLFGGMKVALEMGITGASYFTGAAQRAGQWGKKKTAAMAVGGAEMATRQARAWGAEKASKALASVGQRLGLAGRPLVIGAEKAATYAQRTKEKNVDVRLKDIQSWSKEERDRMEKAALATGGTLAAAFGLYKSQKKQFDDPLEFDQKYYKTMKERGLSHELEAATGINKPIREAIESNKSNEELQKIVRDEFAKKSPEKTAQINWKAIAQSSDKFSEAAMLMIHKLNPAAVVDAYNTLGGDAWNNFHNKFMKSIDARLSDTEKGVASARQRWLENQSPALAGRMASPMMRISFEDAGKGARVKTETVAEDEGVIKIAGKYEDASKYKKEEKT